MGKNYILIACKIRIREEENKEKNAKAIMTCMATWVNYYEIGPWTMQVMLSLLLLQMKISWEKKMRVREIDTFNILVRLVC